MSIPTPPQKNAPGWLARPGSGSRPRRSMSESTVDFQSGKDGLDSGAVKIVIDRPATATHSQTENEDAIPTLEVPIPHYRLGTPRFSDRGTAFLHNSIYTRSSVAEDFGSSLFVGGDYDRMFPQPPGMESLQPTSRRQSHMSPHPYSIHRLSTTRPTPSPSFPSQTHPQSMGPVSSHIYDGLASNPDDPAMVKYSPTTGEIVAASPGRIIAQITSENFLDYELLSDFFLTVRAYLSTQDLLSLLVARFEWAINRFDDNGRVIRVRAFAALRHWILNYFSYDFLVDRDLRVEFCDRLNALTRVVRARANYGASDMKLISDLKKCWNGRCMLYWDNPSGAADAQDLDIQPGGVLGSRDSELSHPSQLSQLPIDLPLAGTVGGVLAGSTLAKWYNAVPEITRKPVHSHNRHSSVATTRSLPISPGSEQSVPVLSCSIPAKGFKKAIPYSSRNLGIHPVAMNTEGRRVCPAAPSTQAYAQMDRPATGYYRRSGSFSDAARDKREPLSAERSGAAEEYVQVAYPYAGSLIRGNIVFPGEPYVPVLAPSSPFSEIPSVESALNSGNIIYGNRKPGAKNLLGNIRRALSSKNTPSSHSSNGNGSAPSLPIGKGGSIPMTAMYQAVAEGQLESFRSNSRIDLLAAQIALAFHNARLGSRDGEGNHLSSIGVASGNEREQPSPDKRQPSPDVGQPQQGLAPPVLRRMESGVTNGSQSILIMDDTGLNVSEIPPVPRTSSAGVDSYPSLSAGVSAYQFPLQADSLVPDTNTTKSENKNVRELLPLERQLSVSSQGLFSSNQRPAAPRPSISNRGQSYKSSKSGSTSLRRYASYQSTFTKHACGPSNDDETTFKPAAGDGSSLGEEAPAHVLRRRPGGDLRANLNVHDLQEITRPRSTGSITTYSDSLRGSGLLSPNEGPTRTVPSYRSSRVLQNPAAESIVTGTDSTKTHSYVRTHSSQPTQRRPSFEAAVAEFARIPDDEEGGIEATLLKLEGKYQKSPVQSPVPLSFPENIHSQNRSRSDMHTQDPLLSQASSKSILQSEDGEPMPPPLQTRRADSGESSHTATARERTSLPRETTRVMVESVLYTESEDSYNSTPLLERGDSRNNGDPTDSMIQTTSYQDELRLRDAAFETQSMRRLKHGSSAPTVTTDSFLLDEDDDFLSDLSSEMSYDFLDRDAAEDQGTQPQRNGTKENTVLAGNHPPSPPMTMENAISISAQANHAHNERKPPTPDPSPVSRLREPNTSDGSIGVPQVTPRMPGEGFKQSRHLCFILGFDSECLAQQFTIIEKDALGEIDWRDLVDMRWQHTAPPVTNWVEYLQTQDPQGIDLVTARFNIMVKWALSEIILTQHIEERALTIMKYIHVAQQARKAHNFATLLQVTIALTSTDCTRLTKTWELVPGPEKAILQELEALVTPRRNFHNLRQEMEKANAEEGCIPVVGTSPTFHPLFPSYELIRVSQHCTSMISPTTLRNPPGSQACSAVSRSSTSSATGPRP